MNRLHLFNPENDLALAGDFVNYTPPPQAVAIRNAGVALPLWYGNDGDRFIASGINARWLDNNTARFGLNVKPFDEWHSNLIPRPWGWSKYARTAYLRRGIPTNALPDDNLLYTWRNLSHRRTAIKLGSLLQAELPFAIAPPATECYTFDDVLKYVQTNGRTVLKLPWSSSGRGLLTAEDPESLIRQKVNIEGVIRHQGSILAEQRLNKKLDFAMLFDRNNGKSSFAGYSVFSTVDSTYSYIGNILAADNELKHIIAATSSAKQLDALENALPDILDSLLESYEGPFGIDMMACSDAEFMIATNIEINLRMTMGHFSRCFSNRFLAPSRKGFFSIVPFDKSLVDDCSVLNCRLRSGLLLLSQPGNSFCITARITP